MGGGQSTVRASHFQNENAREELTDSEDDISPNHISISNKMVERLVEDATVAGGAAAAAVSAPNKTEKHLTKDVKERLLFEKLEALDDIHSEKFGLTIENVKAATKRVELRTVNLPQVNPVCQDCAGRLIECYESCDRVTNAAKCSDAVTAFSKCVQETAVTRCRARTAKDAREAARRTRHVAQARHHALKDILPPTEVPS